MIKFEAGPRTCSGQVHTQFQCIYLALASVRKVPPEGMKQGQDYLENIGFSSSRASRARKVRGGRFSLDPRTRRRLSADVPGSLGSCCE